MVYIISYDLNQPGQQYDSLYEEIKGLGAWWHHLDSTWMVETTVSAAEIRDSLSEHLDQNDKILVIEVRKHWAARGFKDKAYDWIKNRNW